MGMILQIYEDYLEAKRMTHKKAREKETALNMQERERGGVWYYTVEPTDHEKRFVIAVWDGSCHLLGYL